LIRQKNNFEQFDVDEFNLPSFNNKVFLFDT
jgi:hypothetical protein